MSELPSALQTIGVVLATWTLLSVMTAVVLLPWLRSRARANELPWPQDRCVDWADAADPGDARPAAPR